MTDILKNVLNIATRVHDMQIAGTFSIILFGVVLVFGLMNCILGYRLLRFWMMLFGFFMGAGFGIFMASQLGVSDKTVYAAAGVGTGVVLAIISFAVYKAGVYIMGAGIGLTLTIYVIHPTTSFSFFICLLTGVVLGFLAMRYEREVIIVGTSILGGVLAGFSIAKLAKMDEIPFGIIFSIGCALVGMLIQFAINRSRYEDEDEDYDDDEEDEEDFRERRERFERKTAEAQARGEDPYVRAEDFGEEEEYGESEEPFASKNVKNRRQKTARPDDDAKDYEDTDELLEEYGIDEDEVIEEYLEDYYGENKKKKNSAKAVKSPKTKTSGMRTSESKNPESKNAGTKASRIQTSRSRSARSKNSRSASPYKRK